MTPDGWRSPEFEPDRRRRSHTMPMPVAFGVRIVVVLYVTVMVSVATHAYFAPVSREDGRAQSDADFDAVRSQALLGDQTVPGTTFPTTAVAGAGDGGVTDNPGAADSTPRMTTEVGNEGGRVPSGTTRTAPVTTASASPVAPASPGSPAVTVRPSAPPTTAPTAEPEPALPRASRSEAECPLVSGASTATRATTLIVNLLDGPVVVTVNGQRIEVEEDGCRTVTVDASDPAGIRSTDLVQVARAETACSARFAGPLVEVARSYELQISEGVGRCEGLAVVQPGMSLVEAQLWRGTGTTGQSG